APSVNPYNHQEHLYSKNQPENLDFLRRFRSALNEYGACAVGEVGDAQYGLEIMGQYTRGDDFVQMCYAFEFLARERLTAPRVAQVFDLFDQVAGDGWACWAFSNHDVMRHATRWELPPAAQRLYATLLLCLRGSICLYQGEELGLPEADVEFEDLRDPYGLEFWPKFKGRDGCRTPMVWEPSNQNGGFSTGRPWLPVSSHHLTLSVAAQENDPTALLHHYRRALAFRRSQPALTKGEQSKVRAEGDVVWFTRSFGEQTMFCAFNLGDVPAAGRLPEGRWRAVGAELETAVPTPGGVHLGPWQVCLALGD
ncbi:MAG: DUF3459 domain-containing protein, partial [Pseudomonadota bacterium]